MKYEVKKFNNLSPIELYDLLELRSEVFVLEQDCVYQDLDRKDLKAYHLLGYSDGELVAYARLLDRGISYLEDCSIGRVCTRMKIRNTGVGKSLMREAIYHCQSLFAKSCIKISAQTYLLKFYTDLGFHSTGKEYLEDNIPHIEMRMKIRTK